MPTPIKILIVEDSEDDTLLLLRELQRGGFEPVHERVETAEAMQSALKHREWDLVISDYLLPRFSGLAALDVLKQSGVEAPFIIVSGNIGEDIAVEAMKAGAHDYIIKGSLARLVPAIERELREADVRRERKRAEATIQAAEEQYRLLFANSLDAVLLMTTDGQILAANPAACGILGMSEAEIAAAGKYGILDPSDPRVAVLTEERQRTGRTRGEVFVSRKDGTRVPCEISSVQFIDRDGNQRLSIVARDITERKKAEERITRLTRLYSVLSRVNEAIVRITDAEKLHQEVCRIAVEEGGFRMAWIGLADPVTREVRSVARFGDAGGYLDAMATIALDGPEGNGPTGRAIREGRHVICGDIEHDPTMLPWRDKAFGHGFRSSAAFPLKAGPEVIGALTIYAGMTQFFTDDETALLTSLAEDISFALEAMANEKKRREAEKQAGLTNALLGLFTQKVTRKEYLDSACAMIRRWSGFNHVGIRIADPDRRIPFESCAGYNEDFLKEEGGLILDHDHCICTRVIAGAPEQPDLAAMTPNGSFYSGSTKKFLERLESGARTQYRGVCMKYGFNSLAVVPIRYRNTPIGAIHMADEREGLAPRTAVEFLEQLAHIIGEAVFRFGIEDELRTNYANLRKTSELLEKIFSTTHMLVVYLDRDFNFIRVNRAYAAAEKNEPDYFIGRNYFDLCPDKELEPTFRQVVKTGEPYFASERPFAYAGSHKGKTSFWDWSLQPVKEADGAISGLVFTLIDVTDRMKAEENLRLANAYNRSLIEASLDPLVTIGPDGTITDVNAATEIATGRLRDELIGTDFSEYFTDPARARAGYQQVFREGKVMDYALELRHRGGRVTPVLYNASLYRNKSGEVIGIFAAARDITALKKTQEERARLASAVESTAEAVVITDAETGVVQYVNPAFEQITGYAKEEALGRSLHFLDSGRHEKEFYRELREALKTRGVWRGQLMNKKKDGTRYFEDCTFSPVRDESGAIINFVSVKRDVTEKLRLESIAESVSTMNSIGYVFSGVRHEIGNPINSAKMSLSVLQHKLDTASKETVRDYVDRALGEIGRVEQLLKNLRNFNLYETPELERLNMRDFLDKFLSLVTEDFRKKGISIGHEVDPDAVAMADQRALQQVLLNLMTNAADALADRRDPAISIAVSSIFGRVLIRLSDNGCGMTEKQQADLFKPFYTSKPHGTGLGLVIVKKMLTRMNGDIEVASMQDQGTTVSIYLPEGDHGAT